MQTSLFGIQPSECNPKREGCGHPPESQTRMLNLFNPTSEDIVCTLCGATLAEGFQTIDAR